MPGARPGAVWRKADLWAGLFWLGLGLFAVWQGQKLGYGSLSDPGTGFPVFWAGMLIVGFAAVVVGQAVLEEGGATVASLWRGARWHRVVVVLAALGAYAALFSTLGFLLCTLALLSLLLLGVERVSWRLAVPLILVATFGTWFAVTRWLKILLPVGVLG
jgi:putative tricarboxylic transport membrane protein